MILSFPFYKKQKGISSKIEENLFCSKLGFDLFLTTHLGPVLNRSNPLFFYLYYFEWVVPTFY